MADEEYPPLDQRAEEALRAERDFAESLVDTAQAIVLVLDLQGRVVRFNPFLEQLSGYRLEEVQGKDWFTTFLPQPDQNRMKALFLRAIHNIQTQGNVNPLRTKDGQERQIEWYDKTLKDAAGNTCGLLSIGLDITDRLQAEEAVRRNATWLRSLIDTTQDAVVSIDRHGHIVLFNPSAEQMFGYTHAEVQGQKVTLLMAEPYASEHDGYIERYERTRVPRAIGHIRTVSARRKNGEVFPAEISIMEVSADDEIPYAAFIRDISQRVQLQEQLIERKRLATIGTTAAQLAHEIGNPLYAIALKLEFLELRFAQQSDGTDEHSLTAVRQTQQEISRLMEMLNEFRSLSRRQSFTFRLTALPDLVAELLTAETPHYTACDVQVEHILPAALPLIMADRDKLKQVLLNLCKNAVEAMPKGGTLTVRAHHSGQHVTVEVANTGGGIPNGVNIFELFTTTKAEGTGLGLPIAQQIVAAHEGTLRYTSAPGQGTTFTMVLPVTPSVASEAPSFFNAEKM